MYVIVDLIIVPLMKWTRLPLRYDDNNDMLKVDQILRVLFILHFRLRSELAKRCATRTAIYRACKHWTHFTCVCNRIYLYRVSRGTYSKM